MISGHTHAAYNCSATTVDVTGSNGAVRTPRETGLPNCRGRLVPVTSASAFGRVLTDIDVEIDPETRDVVAVTPTNRLVDRTDADIKARIDANPEVKNVVDAYGRPSRRSPTRSSAPSRRPVQRGQCRRLKCLPAT